MSIIQTLDVILDGIAEFLCTCQHYKLTDCGPVSLPIRRSGEFIWVIPWLVSLREVLN